MAEKYSDLSREALEQQCRDNAEALRRALETIKDKDNYLGRRGIEISRIEGDLEDWRKRHAQAQNEVQRLDDELSELKSRNETLEKAVEIRDGWVKEIRSQVDGKESRISELRVLYENAVQVNKKNVDELCDERNAAREEVNRLQQIVKDFNVGVKNERIQELEAELANVKSLAQLRLAERNTAVKAEAAAQEKLLLFTEKLIAFEAATGCNLEEAAVAIGHVSRLEDELVKLRKGLGRCVTIPLDENVRRINELEKERDKYVAATRKTQDFANKLQEDLVAARNARDMHFEDCQTALKKAKVLEERAIRTEDELGKVKMEVFNKCDGMDIHCVVLRNCHAELAAECLAKEQAEVALGKVGMVEVGDQYEKVVELQKMIAGLEAKVQGAEAMVEEIAELRDQLASHMTPEYNALQATLDYTIKEREALKLELKSPDVAMNKLIEENRSFRRRLNEAIDHLQKEIDEHEDTTYRVADLEVAIDKSERERKRLETVVIAKNAQLAELNTKVGMVHGDVLTQMERRHNEEIEEHTRVMGELLHQRDGAIKEVNKERAEHKITLERYEEKAGWRETTKETLEELRAKYRELRSNHHTAKRTMKEQSNEIDKLERKIEDIYGEINAIDELVKKKCRELHNGIRAGATFTPTTGVDHFFKTQGRMFADHEMVGWLSDLQELTDPRPKGLQGIPELRGERNVY